MNQSQIDQCSEGYIDVMAKMADTNGDGKIDFEEFLQMIVNG